MTEEEVRRYQENKRKQHPDVAPFGWLFLKLISEMSSNDAFKGLSKDDLETKAAGIAGRLIDSYRESIPNGIISIEGGNSIFLYKELFFNLKEKMTDNGELKGLTEDDAWKAVTSAVDYLIKGPGQWKNTRRNIAGN